MRGGRQIIPSLLTGGLLITSGAALFNLVLSTPRVPGFSTASTSSDSKDLCITEKPVLTAWTPVPAGSWTGESGLLDGPSSVRLNVCSPSLLEMTMNGSVVDGSGPLMLVTLDDRTLLQREIRSRTTLNVEIPRAGTVHVSFPNDRYRSDVRGVLVTRLWPQGSVACTAGPVDVRSVGAAPSWNEVWGGALYDQGEYHLDTCGPGVLRLGVNGLVGEGIRPELKVLFGDRVLFSASPAGVQQYDVNVPNRGTVRMLVENGYARELANRKLVIERLDMTRK